MGPLELHTLHENNIETVRPIVIVDWTNEEGSRFAPAMVASGVWAGALDRDYAYGRTDINGLPFWTNWIESDTGAMRLPRNGRFTPTSNTISSKAPCWNAKA